MNIEWMHMRKAQLSEAFIFPMWSVFPKASKTESGQPEATSFDLNVYVQNEAGFQCIVTLLHLHAPDNQWNLHKINWGRKSYVVEKLVDSHLVSQIHKKCSFLNVWCIPALSVNSPGTKLSSYQSTEYVEDVREGLILQWISTCKSTLQIYIGTTCDVKKCVRSAAQDDEIYAGYYWNVH